MPCLRAVKALLLDMLLIAARTVVTGANEDYANVVRMIIRTEELKDVALNLNLFSEQKCLARYIFKHDDISRISNMVNLQGVTELNSYQCDPVQATCIYLHRLVNIALWNDLEQTDIMFE